MKTHLSILHVLLFLAFSAASAFAQNSVTLFRYWAPPAFTGAAPELLGQDAATITFLDGSGSVTYTATDVAGTGVQAGLNIYLTCSDVTTTSGSGQHYYYYDYPPYDEPSEDDGSEDYDGTENIPGTTEPPPQEPLTTSYSSTDGTGAPTDFSFFVETCPCPDSGMAVAGFNPYLGSLRITDAPLPYRSPFGPLTGIRFHYDSEDRSALGKPRYSNMGPRWKLNWVQFVEEGPGDSGRAWLNMGRGGKAVMKAGAGSAMTRPGLSLDTLDRAVVDGVVTYVHTLTNGTKETYSVVGGIGSNHRSRYFLKSVQDVHGNTVVLTWQFHPAGVRLSKLTDASGKVTQFLYDNGLKPMRITRILDPFNRAVTLEYHASGELWRLTDPAGIISEFGYEAGSVGLISTMNTPYGASTISRGAVHDAAGNVRVGNFMEILDPAGRRQRVERYSVSDLSSLGNEGVPSGFDASALNVQTTFMWNHAAISAAGAAGVPLGAQNARITRWAQRAGAGRAAPLVASFKAPLTNRVWYLYAGSANSNLVGTHSGVAAMGRMRAGWQTLPEGAALYETTMVNFNDKGRPTTVTDFFGRQTIYTYGTAGTDPQVGADDTDLTGVQASAAGNAVTLQELGQYENHRPTVLKAIDGTVTQVIYNGRGQVHTLTDAAGRETTVTYDGDGPAFGRIATVTNVSGTTVLTYDEYGRVKTVTNPQNETTTVDYDEINGPLWTLDRVTKVTHPNGMSERVVWDKLDVAESYDMEEKKTTYVHDAARRVLSVTGPDEKTITYQPGTCCGSIDSMTDAGGNRTHWKYDILGRVTEKWLNWNQSIPNGLGTVRVQFNTYDDWGRSVSTTDARGNVRTLVYDEQGRMKDIQYTVAAGTAPTPDVHVVYETPEQSPFGRVVRVESADGTGYYDSYEYVPIDASDTVYGDGRVRKVSKGSMYSSTYTYDILGRVSATVLEAGGVTVGGSSSAWDTLGRLTGTTNLLGTQELHYDGNTGRVAWTKVGNLRTNYGYTADTEHRLYFIQNGWNGNWHQYADHYYTYDPAGRMDVWGQALYDGVRIWRMGYDPSGQLETVEISIQNEDPTPTHDLHFYQYDASGNRTGEQRGGAVRSWTANAFNQVTEQTAGGTMELRGNVNVQSKVTVTPVDTEGTPTGAAIAATLESGDTQWKARANVGVGTRRFSVKAEQAQVPQGLTPQETTRTLEVNVPAEQAVTFTYDADGNMTSNGIWTYTWDAENRLVSAKIPVSTNGTEVAFSYDAFHRRVKIVEVVGATTVSDKTLMWDGLTITAQRENQTGELRVFHGNGETRFGATTLNLYYTRDHLGSIRDLVDASNGTVRARYGYTPYGIRTKLGGDLDADFGYTGHYTNARTGLVLAPYRAYSPELGRWISRDPIEEAGGINLYGYVGNGPLGRIDPLGLADYFMGLDFQAFWSNLGLEGGGGFVWDDDSPLDSGIYCYAGGGVGNALSLSVLIGMVQGDIEGQGYNLNAGGAVGGTIMFDDKGNFNGGSVGAGVGGGWCATTTNTKTLTIRKVVQKVMDFFNWVGSAFDSDGPPID